MPVPISNVGRHGSLKLTFALRHGRTALREAYCEVPFKITRLHESSFLGLPHLILMQCTAGVFGGDRLDCAIRVESGARVLITQQAATKVHPSAAGVAIQQTRIEVDSGGELYLYYDPLIPFSGSRLQQTTSLEVSSGARLCFWESLVAGRIGHGEAWEFDELSSETSLRLNGQRIFLDRFVLAPKLKHPSAAWAMSEYRYLGSGLYFGEDADDFRQRLRESLSGAAVDTPAPSLASARVVAADGPSFYRFREAFVKTSRP